MTSHGAQTSSWWEGLSPCPWLCVPFVDFILRQAQGSLGPLYLQPHKKFPFSSHIYLSLSKNTLNGPAQATCWPMDHSLVPWPTWDPGHPWSRDVCEHPSLAAPPESQSVWRGQYSKTVWRADQRVAGAHHSSATAHVVHGPDSTWEHIRNVDS